MDPSRFRSAPSASAAAQGVVLSGDHVELSGEATLSAVDAALVRAGRWLPVDGPGEGEVGLLITRDSAGPLRAGFGGWEEHIVTADLEGPGGRTERMQGEAARLAVGSRGALGRITRLELRTHPRPESALAARLSTDAPGWTPHWRLAARSAHWAGWLGSHAEIDAADGALINLPGGVQVIRQALAEDEALRTRLWRWPEGVEGERVRLHLPPSSVRTMLLEGRVLAWVSEPGSGTVLATLPAREVSRIAAVASAHGGWVERVERDLDPAEVRWRWGEAGAERFEELRRRLSRP